MSSQSEWEISFSFVGTGKVIKGHILRWQAPQTFETLQDKIREAREEGKYFTVRSRANIGRVKNYWMLLVDLKRGREKSEYKTAKIGDIVYCPRQDALYLIFDTPTINLPVFYIGEITEGIEALSDMRNGTMVKIEVKDISKN
ncbi:MAG: hypothetical protein ACTSWW_11790 [Promethearchaeota archaeon]